MTSIKLYPCASVEGEVLIPGDKSISHRALMFASIAKGESRIKNLLEGHDCLATLQVMRALGVHIELKDDTWIVHGEGKAGLHEPSSILNCKNSGTTIRLMAGLLSAMPFMSILDGTDQIKSRPMDRIIKPLRAMGANIYGRSDRFAPLVSLPSALKGGEYELHVKSAQVKSALILAALFAEGETIIHHTKATRDHTERLLSHMGASIKMSEDTVHVQPLNKELDGFSLRVPGDISSAAFLLVAGAVLSPRGLTLRQVGINPSRTGILDAMQIMGAKIEQSNNHELAHEPVADLTIKKSSLKGAHFSGDIIVRMIDEIPILALLATQAEGRTVIKDAHELKVKESNRIAKTVELLSALGAQIEETEDGMIIEGPCTLHGANISSFGDHRLGMMMSIAALMADSPMTIQGAQVSDDSYPGFYQDLESLGAVSEIFHD